MDLDDEMAEVFKINIETRKKLGEIEANDALTSQQKLEQGNLAKEEQADKLRALRVKKEKEANKKAFEDKKKEDEDLARDLIKTQDALIKREQTLFEKGVKDFKDAQEEKIKAAEEANRQIEDSSRKASQKITEQDSQAKKDFEDKTGADVSVLGATRGGQMALEQARKSRKVQTKQEDFRTQEKILQAEAQRLSKEENKPITMQDVRMRMATRQAATEMPSLAEKLSGTASGIDPAQVARSRSEETMSKGGQGIPDILNALQSLVDVMKSGTVVK